MTLFKDPPAVKTMSQRNITEGDILKITCEADPGNPNSTMFIWSMEGSSEFTQNGATLQLPNIRRTSSGIYKCTAQNNYDDGQKGTDSQSVVVNVLCEFDTTLYHTIMSPLSKKRHIVVNFLIKVFRFNRLLLCFFFPFIINVFHFKQKTLLFKFGIFFPIVIICLSYKLCARDFSKDS